MKQLRTEAPPLWAVTAGDFYGTADVFNQAKSHFVAEMMPVMLVLHLKPSACNVENIAAGFGNFFGLIVKVR